MSSRTYPFALPRGTEISGYMIQEVLGAGGFGITYSATNPVTLVTVAVKEFYPQGFASREGARVLLHSDVSTGSYEQALRKFEQEAAKLTARYSHPNIVRGMNFLRANNTAYFIMEFIEGVSFDDWLAAQTSMPDEALLRTIFDPVLDAVAYIHSRDGMHRDLTPRNIMVRSDGTAVLVDFGASGEGLDMDRGVSTAFAQPNYAPPEQLAGDDSRLQGRHTDIFSIGGVLYKAVAGHPPVKPLKRSHEVAIAGPSADPYVPAARAAQYPEIYSTRFLAGIDAALKLDYRQRPATIEELRSEFGWTDQPTVAPGDLPTMSLPAATPSAAFMPPPVNAAPQREGGSPVNVELDAASLRGPHPSVDRGPRASKPPIDYTEDTETFSLEPPRRGGSFLTLTVFIGIVVAAALAWFFATGDVPFRSMIAAQPPHATEPAKPNAPVEPAKPPVVPDTQQAQQPPAQPPVQPPQPPQQRPEPPKPAEPKIDYSEFQGFSGTGKELTTSKGSLNQCREACSGTPECRALSQSGESCTLYSDVTGLQPDPDHRLLVRADTPAAKRLKQIQETEQKQRQSLKTIDGVTLAGGTATAKLSLSREQCQFTCTSDQTCKAFSFATLVGACRIYTQVQPKDAKSAVGVVTGLIDPDGQITADIRRQLTSKTRTFKPYPGIELNGANAKRSPQADATACRQLCTEDQTCTTATFADGECTRYTSVETVRARAGAEGMLDATDPKLVERVDDAVKRELKGDAEVLPGFDLLGNPIQSEKARAAQTPEDCQAVCKADQSCAGFSFLHAEKKCTIEQGVTDAVPDPTRTSGLFRGAAASTIDAIKRRVQQSEATRASFRDMPATCTPTGLAATTQLGPQAAPEQCAFLCRAGTNCQGWTFNRNDHTCTILSSITGAQAGTGMASGIFDPSGRRVAELVRSCGPVPPGALVGTPANECDRQAGLANDAELPRGIEPKPLDFIDPKLAIPACLKAAEAQPSVLRWRVSLGRAYERAGRLEEARAAYQQAAEAGSGPGAFFYAVLVNKGLGGPQDDTEAERYFKIARSRGYAPASTALGLLYTYGDRPTTASEPDALRLLEEAAQRGQASAMYRLGEAYDRGRLNRRPVPADPQLAQQWYARALEAFRREADEGRDVTAYRYLSLMYDTGRGVQRDVDQSLRYLVAYFSSLYGPDNTLAQERGTVGELHLDDWSVETRRAFQQYLRDRGVFSGPADGNPGPATTDAVDRWLGLRG
jgi:serine/threonine protein kinase/tetratricopeptide (TPR) repeat protein